MEHEKKRADSYLHKSTLNELIKTTYDCLIGNHIETIAAEFTNLLKENRVEGALVEASIVICVFFFCRFGENV